MSTFLLVTSIGLYLIIKSLISIRRSYTVIWVEALRIVVGLFWLFGVYTTLFLNNTETLYECLGRSQQFLWPGVILTLAVMASGDMVNEKKAEDC